MVFFSFWGAEMSVQVVSKWLTREAYELRKEEQKTLNKCKKRPGEAAESPQGDEAEGEDPWVVEHCLQPSAQTALHGQAEDFQQCCDSVLWDSPQRSPEAPAAQVEERQELALKGRDLPCRLPGISQCFCKVVDSLTVGFYRGLLVIRGFYRGLDTIYMSIYNLYYFLILHVYLFPADRIVDTHLSIDSTNLSMHWARVCSRKMIQSDSSLLSLSRIFRSSLLLVSLGGGGQSSARTTNASANSQAKKTDCARGRGRLRNQAQEEKEGPAQDQAGVAGGRRVLSGWTESLPGFGPWEHFSSRRFLRQWGRTSRQWHSTNQIRCSNSTNSDYRRHSRHITGKRCETHTFKRSNWAQPPWDWHQRACRDSPVAACKVWQEDKVRSGQCSDMAAGMRDPSMVAFHHVNATTPAPISHLFHFQVGIWHPVAHTATWARIILTGASMGLIATCVQPVSLGGRSSTWDETFGDFVAQTIREDKAVNFVSTAPTIPPAGGTEVQILSILQIPGRAGLAGGSKSAGMKLRRWVLQDWIFLGACLFTDTMILVVV